MTGVPDVPPVPEALARPCEVPKLEKKAIKSLVSHRVAVIECKKRHQAVVDWHNSLTKYGSDK